MNPFTALFNRDGRKKLAWATVCAAMLGSMSTLAVSQPISSNRFLFIIDTSASMKPFEKAVGESLFDLIYSGIRGHMTNGDTYGIWLIGEENDMSFKMETWRQRFTVELAARAAAHVNDHGFKGKLNLTQAFADAATVIQNVEDLTVILISNGENKISGTPFDDTLNVRFGQLAPAMKKSRATLNTVLIARDKRFVAWTVNSPDFLIDVPYVAPTPRRVKPEVTATKSPAPDSAPAVPAAVAAAENRPTAPRIPAPPIIITKDTVAQERRELLAMTSTLTDEPIPEPATTNAVTPTMSAIAAQAVPAVATNIKTATAIVVTTNSLADQPATPPTNGTVAPAGAVTKSESTNAAAITPPATPTRSTPAVKPAAGVATTTVPVVQRLLWAGLGAGGAFTCVLAVAFFCRSRRQEPSLISQSLMREQSHVS